MTLPIDPVEAEGVKVLIEEIGERHEERMLPLPRGGVSKDIGTGVCLDCDNPWPCSQAMTWQLFDRILAELEEARTLLAKDPDIDWPLMAKQVFDAEAALTLEKQRGESLEKLYRATFKKYQAAREALEKIAEPDPGPIQPDIPLLRNWAEGLKEIAREALHNQGEDKDE